MTSPFVDALTLHRTFNAPRTKVFNAWKDPELLKQWLGGQQQQQLHAEVDFRVGGHYRVEVQSPTGNVFYVTGMYQEIDEPQRIVFTWAFDNAPRDIEATLVTVTFSEAAGKTDVTLTHERFRDVPTRQLHSDGWGACFDRIDKLLN